MGPTKARSKARRRRMRHAVEAYLFGLAFRLIPRLPRGTVVGLAGGLGWLAWHLDRRDRRIALANLTLAYGSTLPDDEKRAIVRRVFRNFAQTALDYFWFSRDTRNRFARYVTLDEALVAALRQGPLIAVTAHYGNWEVLGQAAAALHGAPLSSVAKPIKNPLIDQRVNRMREETGQHIIAREGAIKSLVKALRDKGVVALVLDQDTRVSDGGVFVDFFGVPVPISNAAAGLALRLRVPMMMAFSRHEAGGRYRCYLREWLSPEAVEGTSIEDLTARITGVVEAEIRQDPAQWLWTYKRWKRRQPGFDASRYPFYADC